MISCNQTWWNCALYSSRLNMLLLFVLKGSSICYIVCSFNFFCFLPDSATLFHLTLSLFHMWLSQILHVSHLVAHFLIKYFIHYLAFINNLTLNVNLLLLLKKLFFLPTVFPSILYCFKLMSHPKLLQILKGFLPPITPAWGGQRAPPRPLNLFYVNLWEE